MDVVVWKENVLEMSIIICQLCVIENKIFIVLKCFFMSNAMHRFNWNMKLSYYTMLYKFKTK